MQHLNLSASYLLVLVLSWPLFPFTRGMHAQESPLNETEAAAAASTDEGPRAALDFEKSFRREGDGWNPVPLEKCPNIRELTDNFWSKKHVLTDFKQFRTDGQVGAIVIVKTEFCCDDSRLCAVTTACMEKKSTPLIGRFRVYAGWIKNHPDYAPDGRLEWDQKVMDEYDFIQGPGARIVVMVPTFDGKMYQWYSDATELELSLSDMESNNGRTVKLEQFLAEAVKYARPEPYDVELFDLVRRMYFISGATIAPITGGP